MAEILQLHKPVATCPQCKGQHWFIHLNGFYDEYDKVTAHECCECGFLLKIEVEVIKEDANRDTL